MIHRLVHFVRTSQAGHNSTTQLREPGHSRPSAVLMQEPGAGKRGYTQPSQSPASQRVESPCSIAFSQTSRAACQLDGMRTSRPLRCLRRVGRALARSECQAEMSETNGSEYRDKAPS